MCNIHSENKLKNFCLTCRKAICQICQSELHSDHNIENVKSLVTEEDIDKMIQIIKEKEEKFNDEMNENEQKIESGFDNMIQKLNEEKINYKKQLGNYKDNHQKTFDFLKNLYMRYINQSQNDKENINNENILENNENIKGVFATLNETCLSCIVSSINSKIKNDECPSFM